MACSDLEDLGSWAAVVSEYFTIGIIEIQHHSDLKTTETTNYYQEDTVIVFKNKALVLELVSVSPLGTQCTSLMVSSHGEEVMELQGLFELPHSSVVPFAMD